jgi:hypothetical protein
VDYWIGKLDDGSPVVFEVEPHGHPPGPSPVSRFSDTLEKAGGSIEESLDSVKRLAETVVRKLRESAPETPNEIQVSFGLKVVAELQAFAIAKASGEANYTVTLKWVKPGPKAEGGPAAD